MAILDFSSIIFLYVGVELTSTTSVLKRSLVKYGEMQKGWTAEDCERFHQGYFYSTRVYYNNHKDEEI